MRGHRLARGMRLKIYPGGLTPPAAGKSRSREVGADGASLRSGSPKAAVAGGPAVHHVQPGETLWSIARSYQTTVEALRRANQFLLNRQVQTGDQLMILSNSTPASHPPESMQLH
jgi:LysM repeat protein